MKIPKFTAVAPDPAANGTDVVSKQVRALEAAGYTLEQRQFFFRTTDSKDYAARLAETNAMRLYIHIAADDMGNIHGCSFDPEHVFALALKAGLSADEVRVDIMNTRAQHDEDTHTNTARRIDSYGQNSTAVYTARAAQVANHGR